MFGNQSFEVISESAQEYNDPKLTVTEDRQSTLPKIQMQRRVGLANNTQNDNSSVTGPTRPTSNVYGSDHFDMLSDLMLSRINYPYSKSSEVNLV
jgi:hypothetical protein